ncbi:MAG TPA: hypothetical protein VGP70_26100 [Actinomadura sp.]|nr:hypothetical protein [Actinomadura sp.]
MTLPPGDLLRLAVLAPPATAASTAAGALRATATSARATGSATPAAVTTATAAASARPAAGRAALAFWPPVTARHTSSWGSWHGGTVSGHARPAGSG